MKKKLLSLFLLLALITSACEKDRPEVEPKSATNPTKPADPATLFLKEVSSDASSEFYISGEFDGHLINFASTYYENDPTYNAIYLDSSQNLDNMHLIRNNKSRAASMAIFFSNTKMATRPLPYHLPHANLDYCESAELQLINFASMGTATQGSPDDNFTFIGITGPGVKVQVTSFENQIIEGVFEGRLQTRAGSAILVKNGKFRLKLEKYIW